jgi:hypothetical protein
MDWHELEKKKVDELREMAVEKAGVTGATGLHKDQLVEIVAEALGIEKPHLVVEGIDKTAIKRKIKVLKLELAEARENKDAKLAKAKRRHIHRLKRRIHKAAHLTH